MTTPRYAMQDTRKPDGFYVQFRKVLEDDEAQPRPDELDEGFWPSRDAASPGYVLPEHFDSEHLKAARRMQAWRHGDWSYIGVKARALCFLVVNGVGTHMTLESPGLWGVESDAHDYIAEVYAEQVEELKGLIERMRSPIYEPIAA